MEAQANVTVISATLDDIARIIDQKTDERIKTLEVLNQNHSSMLRYTVDRAFLKRNFGWSRRKIEEFEEGGMLRRVSNPSDSKGCYYRLSDCINAQNIK